MNKLKILFLKFVWSLKIEEKELTLFQRRLIYFMITDGIRNSYKEKF